MVWTTSMKWKVISLFLIFFQLVQTLSGTPKAVCMDHGWPPSVCLFSSSSPTFFLSTCSLPDSSKSPTNTIPSILLKPSFQGYKHIIPSKSNVLCCSTKILLFCSATFIRNNAKSREIWKFQRYQLIVNYELRPILPPPFTFISHIYLTFKYIIRRCKGKRDFFDNGLSKFLWMECNIIQSNFVISN